MLKESKVNTMWVIDQYCVSQKSMQNVHVISFKNKATSCCLSSNWIGLWIVGQYIVILCLFANSIKYRFTWASRPVSTRLARSQIVRMPLTMPWLAGSSFLSNKDRMDMSAADRCDSCSAADSIRSASSATIIEIGASFGASRTENSLEHACSSVRLWLVMMTSAALANSLWAR